MGRPADRTNGVRLVTDYGVLERALEIKARKEAERKEAVEKLNTLYSQDS